MAQTTEPTEDFMDFDEPVSDPLDLSSITGSRAFPPQKILIYGLPGVGKTTFAATFPPPRRGGSTPNFVLSSRVPMGPNCHTPRSYRGGCANTRDAWHGGRPGRSWDETPGYGPYSGAWKSHTKTDPAAAAIRHTRCVQALTAIGICTDSSVIDVSGPGAQEKQIAKVKCRRDAACEFIVCGHDRKNDTHRTGPAEILAARFADTLTRRDLETVRENCRADGRLQPVPMSMWASSRPRSTGAWKTTCSMPPRGQSIGNSPA